MFHSGHVVSALLLHWIVLCRGLRQLSLKNCPRLKDEHLQALKHAPSTLKQLSLDSCVRLTLSALNILPQDVSLHSLTFKNCASSSSLPERLATLAQLTLLDLSGHEVTDSEVSKLTPLTLLKSLDISGSKLSQEGVDQLSVLSALTFLDMSWTLAHHPPPLAHLRTLHMDSCDVGGSWNFAYVVHASIHGSEGMLFSQIEQLFLNSCSFETADGGQVCYPFAVCGASPPWATLSMEYRWHTTVRKHYCIALLLFVVTRQVPFQVPWLSSVCC
jgi:hypothetical protein